MSPDESRRTNKKTSRQGKHDRVVIPIEEEEEGEHTWQNTESGTNWDFICGRSSCFYQNLESFNLCIRAFIVLSLLMSVAFEFSLIADQYETNFQNRTWVNRVAVYRLDEIKQKMELGLAWVCAPDPVSDITMDEQKQTETEPTKNTLAADKQILFSSSQSIPISHSLPPSISMELLSGWLASGRTQNADQPPVESHGQWTACAFLEQKFGAGEDIKQLLSHQMELEPVYRDQLNISKHQLSHPADISRFLLSASGVACDESTVRMQALRLKVMQMLATTDTNSETGNTLLAVKVYLTHQLRVSDPVLAIGATKSSELHSWINDRPVDHVADSHGKGDADFNLFSGPLALSMCRLTQRMGAIPTDQPRETFVPPGVHKIDPEYSKFVKEAMEGVAAAEDQEKQDQVEGKKPLDASLSPSSTTNLPARDFVSISSGTDWFRPLLPSLPPACRAASFHRPASARRCLAHQRIGTFGDSTTQQLAAILVDFLETRDDELPHGDPHALEWDTPYDPNNPNHMEPSVTGASPEWQIPPSDSSDERMETLFWLNQWEATSSCKSEAHMNRHAQMRRFSTARLPSPYLSAYNITVTHSWNVNPDACENWSAAETGSVPAIILEHYRLLRDSCLPDNAIAIVKQLRSGGFTDTTGLEPLPRSTPMSSKEYIMLINRIFPWETYLNFQGPLQILKRPDCNVNREKYPGAVKYFTDAELTTAPVSNWRMPSDWTSHLTSVPRWDHGIYNQGAHHVNEWEQDPSSAAQQVTKAYTRLGLTWTRQLTRHIIVRETSFRGGRYPTAASKSNTFLHSMYRQAEDEISMHLVSQLESALQIPHKIASDTTTTTFVPSPLCGSAESPVDPSYGPSYSQCSTMFPSTTPWLSSPISWLPEWTFTASTNNWAEPTHCTKFIRNPGPSVGGGEYRSPVCIQIIHGVIDAFCAKNV